MFRLFQTGSTCCIKTESESRIVKMKALTCTAPVNIALVKYCKYRFDENALLSYYTVTLEYRLGKTDTRLSVMVKHEIMMQ